MATIDTQSAIQAVESGIEAQRSWLDPLADQMQAALNKAVQVGGRPAWRVKDFLNGIWLGHPLHPAIVLVPAGAWVTAAFLDALGARRGADKAILVGIVSAVPSAAAGLAEWQETMGTPRRVGLVHAMLNTTALLSYLASYRARRTGRRGLGMSLSSLGLGMVAAGAYLGGDLSYKYGVGIDRNVWAPKATDWTPVGRFDDLPEGQLVGREADVDGQKVPLVLLRRGQEVFALGNICAHMGGPLAEGRLVDGNCVECPWHRSRFDLRTGAVKQAPAAYHQPAYETRQRNGNLEVRLKQA